VLSISIATPCTLQHKSPITSKFLLTNSKEHKPINFLDTEFKGIQAMATSVTTDINAPAQKIFDAVTDLQSYSKWLPDSGSFKGTTEVSETPAKLGTTYVESSPAGVRSGKIIEFDPPSKVVFHQPMKMTVPELAGQVIDIKVEVTLKEKGAVTTLQREVYLGFPEPLQHLKEDWDKGAIAESERVMNLLKEYVESLP
jgi:uncharacterized protein YndB with AHSA1/START domain